VDFAGRTSDRRLKVRQQFVSIMGKQFSVRFPIRIGLMLIALWASAESVRAAMVKTVTTDDECFINVEWTWNPEAVGDTGVHDSANWHIQVAVFDNPGVGTQVLVNALHHTRCHSVDLLPPAPGATKIWAEQFNLPAAGPADTVKTGSVRHRSSEGDHSDNYTFKLRRTGVVANNRFWVYGYHSEKRPVPKLPWWSLIILVLLLLTALTLGVLRFQPRVMRDKR
jgi:hypothetical protein